jgi:single-strand DNA-binding protein
VSADNNCNFVGRLGGDAVRRFTPDGKAVTNFRLAVDRPPRNGNKQEAQWISVTLWGKLAEGKVVDYLVKGKQVAVCGEVELREYEHQGDKRASLELTCRDVRLVGSVERASAVGEEDLPF